MVRSTGVERTRSPGPTVTVAAARLFGGLRLADDAPVRLNGVKRRTLLAYLLLHPDVTHRREVLVDILSPEADPDRGRRELSDTLYRLQRTLRWPWLQVGPDGVSLTAGPGLWVDAWAFDELVARGTDGDLRAAADLYAGELLPDVDEAWAEAPRELRRQRFVAALERLAAHAEAAGRLEDALLDARRLTLAEPLHEPAHQAYMRLLARLRRHGEALEHYEALSRLLAAEVQASPLPETADLAAAIRRERDVAGSPILRDRRPAFVGRTAERATALAAVERALTGRGGAVAVEGEAGIGKSRLLEEIADGARWRGATVLQGRASAVPAESPFQPLADALAPVVHGPLGSQLESLVGADGAGALSALGGALAADGRPPTGDGSAGAGARHAARRLGEVVARLVRPVLMLDDLHWASPALWDFLDAFADGLAGVGGLVVVAYRRAEVEGTPGWETLQAWDRDGHLTTVRLGPLDPDDVARLVEDDRGADPARIHAATGGNPFLVTEWMAGHGLQDDRSTSAATRRLAALGPGTRDVLEVAAIVGDPVPYRLWLATTGLDPMALAVHALSLRDQRWLRQSGPDLAFVHELLRTTVLQAMPRARVRQLHGRAADACRALEPHNLRALAFHLDHAGRRSEAATAYRDAGDRELDRFAFREAQAAFDRALALLPGRAVRERVGLLIALARVCETTGDRVRQSRAIDDAIAGARALGDDALVLQALLVAGDAAAATSRFDRARAVLGEAARLAAATGDPASEALAIFLMGRAATQHNRPGEAQERYRRSLDAARAAADEALEARALRGLGVAARDLGEPAESVRWLEAALEIQRRIGDRRGESITLANLVTALFDLGAWSALLATGEAVLPRLTEQGNRYAAAYVGHLLGLTSLALGERAVATDRCETAVQEYEALGDRRAAGLVRAVLGLIAEDDGDDDRAVRFFREALATEREAGTGHDVAVVASDLGALLARRGETDEAIRLLEEAQATWIRHERRLELAKVEAHLGLASLAAGDVTAAEAMAGRGWERLQAGVPTGEHPQAWLWALSELLTEVGRADEARACSRAAYDELQRQAALIDHPGMRRAFFERVPLNRRIVEARDRDLDARRTITATLARRHAPLGRRLREDERVTVRWTVEAPEDEAIGDPAARRRHRLLRLLEEAEAQGAAPTDDDLAGALRASRRTILRDIAGLSGGDRGRAATRRRG